MDQKVFSEKSDVWSFGVVLWEIVSRQLPFHHIRFMSQVEDMVVAGQRPDMPPHTRREYVTLIRACWHQEASQRPSMGDVVTQLELMNQMLDVRVDVSEGGIGGADAAEDDHLLDA